MDIMYKSTRGDGSLIPSAEAIVQGLAPDGGLFVPSDFPTLDVSFDDLSKTDYRQCAYEVMRLFLTDFSEEELKNCINKAYDDKFDTKEIAPLIKVGDAYHLELFHGATIAFKDMALSILPHLMRVAAGKCGITDEIVILTATSGDTGKAALAGFKDVEGTRIIVFYPKGGVSKTQELQMITQRGSNTFVAAVDGNFDDAQTGVKNMFNNPNLVSDLKKSGCRFSSANSINIGRLVPQIAYYVWAYSRLVKEGRIKSGEKINFVVPTGNFGNILAGYYAKLIGLPVNKFICASNDNKVLYDFLKTGIYNRNREFILTSSPSMDILISSNLERLIYLIAGDDETVNKALMRDLTEKGVYTVSLNMYSKLNDFEGGFAKEAENAACIKETFEKYGYVTDTHTGVARAVYNKYVDCTGDVTPSVIISTASPYKFARSVMTAINPSLSSMDDFALIDELNKVSGVPLPKAVLEIKDAEILHKTVCSPNEMESAVRKFLGI